MEWGCTVNFETAVLAKYICSDVTIGLVRYVFAAYHWDCPFLYVIIPLHYYALYYKTRMTHAPVPANS